VQPSPVANLDALTAGQHVSNPAELLASERLGQLIEEVRSRYDIVIFDTSPLLAVTDPWIISAVVDGILLVVQLGSTRRQDLERTMEVLRTLGAPVLGVVANGVTREQVGYGLTGYPYGYGYGYGQPYGSYGSNGSTPSRGTTAVEAAGTPAHQIEATFSRARPLTQGNGTSGWQNED
jgi:Mrp family chromosome partitioning ATPase